MGKKNKNKGSGKRHDSYGGLRRSGFDDERRLTQRGSILLRQSRRRGGDAGSGDNWILATSFWADTGVWIDGDSWSN